MGRIGSLWPQIIKIQDGSRVAFQQDVDLLDRLLDRHLHLTKRADVWWKMQTPHVAEGGSGSRSAASCHNRRQLYSGGSSRGLQIWSHLGVNISAFLCNILKFV